MTLILSREDEPDFMVVGAKGYSMYQLYRAGFPVPDWATIPAPALKDGMVPFYSFPPFLLDTFESPTKTYLVRSSAIDEDGSFASLAGQPDSFLNLHPVHIQDKINFIWTAAFQERRDYGQALDEIQLPAVIIQKMFPAEISGIALSADPDTGRWGTTVIKAVKGLGEGLLNGETETEDWRVDREGNIIPDKPSEPEPPKSVDPPTEEKPEGEKAEQGTDGGEGQDGKPLEKEGKEDPKKTGEATKKPTKDLPIGKRHAKKAVKTEEAPPPKEEGKDKPETILTEAQVKMVAKLARRCEGFFGVPQGIEWAISGRKIYLMLSRPITTLHLQADPDGMDNIWDNSNIPKYYGGITNPLSFSFAQHIYKEVFQLLFLALRMPRETIETNRDTFTNLLGLVRGRPYYNLMAWYKLMALLPGFRFCHQFVGQITGLKGDLPEPIVAKLKEGGLGTLAKEAWMLLRTTWGLFLTQFKLPKKLKSFRKEMGEALATNPAPLEVLRPDELAEHFHTLENQLLNRWKAPVVNDFLATFYFGLLGKMTREWCWDKDSILQHALLCDTGRAYSGELSRRIRTMAKIASKEPSFCELLANGYEREILKAIGEFEDFSKRYNQYFARFADRSLSELKLENPTLRDDPLPVIRAIGQMAFRFMDGHKIEAGTDKDWMEHAESEVDKHIGKKPIQKFLFNYVLNQARKRVKDREDMRFERTRLFGRVRKNFIEMGKRLEAAHILEDRNDILYLTVPEILGFVEGTTPTTDLNSMAQLRKEEYGWHSEGQPPSDTFGTTGVVDLGNDFIEKPESAIGDLPDSPKPPEGTGPTPKAPGMETPDGEAPPQTQKRNSRGKPSVFTGQDAARGKSGEKPGCSKPPSGWNWKGAKSSSQNKPTPPGSPCSPMPGGCWWRREP